MAATQTQIRRGTSAQCAALTAAAGEILFDTTTKRLRAGDGATAGGIVLPNRIDLQNNTLTYKAAGGTANAITVALDIAPAAYAVGQIVWFLSTATNTGATTINVNGLGVKSILKDNGGSAAALTGGEIVGGLQYGVIYNGSAFVLINPSPATAAAGGGWELLAVANASASASLDFTSGVGAGYVNYALVLSGMLLSSASANLYLRLSQGGSFKATAGDYSTTAFDLVSAAAVASPTNTAIEIARGSGVAVSQRAGQVFINAVAGKWPTIESHISMIRNDTGAILAAYLASGSLIDANTQIDGIRLLPSGGTITSGSAFLYGLRSSL